MRGIDRVAGIAQRRHQLPVQIFVILDDQDAHVIPPLLNAGGDYSEAT